MSGINWTNVEAAARELAGNWQKFTCFAWHRGYELEDAEKWAIVYTSGRDSGLLAQSNHDEIAKRLEPFTEGDDPDVVAESHSHWAVGYVDGYSIRVFNPDGSIAEAFLEYARIQEQLADYPVLHEQNYSEREYTATLENYSSEMWGIRDELPEGWESEVFSWFSDNGHDRFTENRDDGGGWAPREKIAEALQDLGLLPTIVIERGRR